MANRLSKEKAGLIASHYCTNGYKKVLALLDSGYSTSYANGATGLKLYDNVLVKEAISQIEANNKINAKFTLTIAEQNNSRIMAAAEKAGQFSAAVSANVANARLYGMDKDNQLNTDKPQALTEQQLALARRKAIAILDDSMTG